MAGGLGVVVWLMACCISRAGVWWPGVILAGNAGVVAYELLFHAGVAGGGNGLREANIGVGSFRGIA